MSKIYYFLIITLFLSFVIESHSRDFRVNQVPNGKKFSCVGCHVSPYGGGERNPFGETVNDNLSGPASTANVRWDLIFNIDSDGDGFTNGEELQDPDGQWAQGQANPGNSDLVTQPWNPNSKPTNSSVEDDFVNTNSVIYPIPSKGIVNLSYVSNYYESSQLEVFNFNGNLLISEKVESVFGENDYSIDLNNQSLNSGIYYLVLRNKYFNIRKRIVFSK
ncbi:MAG: T9SS type A sorting domain-containing protein [Candidatus Kapaibacterium sp.]